MSVARVGLDIAKNVFQVHAINAEGQVLLRQRLRRPQVLAFFRKLPACTIGLEACPGAHYWARELAAIGHEVRVMPPQYVKPYVKRQKNDSADAEAICEAMSRPTMRFVPVKSEEQQAILALHRTRELLIRQKGMLINALRAQLHEFGIIAAQGRNGLSELIRLVLEPPSERIPELARAAMMIVVEQLKDLVSRLRSLEARILEWHRSSILSRRLQTIPGVGPIIASAVAATVTNAATFRNARQFAAWLGLVPRQNSTGGKDRLGGITKWGDAYIRKLLVVASCSLIRYARGNNAAEGWLSRLLERRPAKVAAVAMANKTARIIWAVLTQERPFQDRSVTAAA
jgi:transposase